MKPYFTVQQIRDAVGGCAREVLANVAGIPIESCDGKHHPCPACGGSDRFRLINQDTGTVYCNQCFNERNGDYITAVMHYRHVPFPEALRLIADYFGLTGDSRRSPPPVPVVPASPKKGPASKYEFKTTFTPTFADDGAPRAMEKSCFAVGRKPWGFRFVWNGYTYRPDPPLKATSTSKIRRHTLYEYADGNGEPYHLVYRMDMVDGKKIPMLFHWNGTTYVPGKGDLQPVPYNAPTIKDAERVFIVEGEKCAAALQWDIDNSTPASPGELPPAVTCFLDGAGAFDASYAIWFRDKDVFIYPDNDEPGRKYAREIVESLHGVARSVRVFRWPAGTPEKWDIADEIMKNVKTSRSAPECPGVKQQENPNSGTVEAAPKESARPPP